MVQRKVIINKLITTHSDKPVVNLRSSSSSSSLHYHHDHRVKNSSYLSTELKKKIMKRSGSIKHQELESVRSANFQKLIKGKVYPADETPQKQQLKADETPNYMKSTSSSVAKKEQSHAQVSTKNPQTCFHSSVSPTKCSNGIKLGINSGKKETNLPSTTNSLRTVRTLAKNSNSKSARNIVKKRPKVILCEDDMIDVRRATCSSTLRDCKFPAYLELSPGGTESEGTSMFKVCPYTYCSLNGHLHKPLPPLKLFLSAKRRAIKAQKSLKVACLSPRGLNPNRDGSKEETQGDDIKRSPIINSRSEEKCMDYFIEVCSKLSEADDLEEETPETVCSEFDSQEALDQTEDDDFSKIISIDEDVSLQALVQEEREVGFLSELDSEYSDMELEMNLVSGIYYDVEYEYLPQTEMETEFKEGEREVHDKFLGDDLPQDSTYVDSDAYSISDHSESIGSEKYDLEHMNYMTTACNEGHKVEINLSETTNTESQVDSYEKEINKTESGTILSHLNSDNETKQKIKMEIGAHIRTEHTAFTQFTAKSRNSVSDLDETASFNPRGPNFLSLEPDPDAEKVDLKHQEVEDRKNAEEWMVDYALRQAVMRLGPARKRKVSLLVEAFEKVMPASKCESHTRQSSAFDLARPVQACN